MARPYAALRAVDATSAPASALHVGCAANEDGTGGDACQYPDCSTARMTAKPGRSICDHLHVNKAAKVSVTETVVTKGRIA